MINKHCLYPACKPSGVPWLGDVPEHWDVRRTKTLLRERSEKGRPSEALLAATQTKGVVRKEQYESRTVLALKDLHLLKLVKIGDFVISLRSFQGGIEYAREQGIISPAYTILYPWDSSLHDYLALLFKSKPYLENLTLHVTGIRQGQNIDYSELSRSYLPLPPLPEQRAIVRYLDHVDRRIRRYVSAKRKLIALLEEEKQAVINQAVTRGLDPNVRLKPSGVEWLGDVPEHWEVQRAKFFFREADERSTTGTEELMSVSHITGVTPRKKSVTMFLAESNMGYKLCRPGDIVINTMWAFMAALGVARQNGLVSPSYGVYRPLNTERLNYDYIDSLLRTQAYRTNYLIRSTGITSSRLRLYPESFLDIPLLCPPGTEQDAIVEHLERATADTNAAITRARRQIDLVQEYRTRLIADVVTGKLDVREAAAQLPDESDEEGPIDRDGLVLDNMDDGSSDVSQLLEEEQTMEREVTA